MPKFTITLQDSVTYESIEADTKEEAMLRAYDWWDERCPDSYVEEEED